jgi:hypothetical protein
MTLTSNDFIVPGGTLMIARLCWPAVISSSTCRAVGCASCPRSRARVRAAARRPSRRRGASACTWRQRESWRRRRTPRCCDRGLLPVRLGPRGCSSRSTFTAATLAPSDAGQCTRIRPLSRRRSPAWPRGHGLVPSTLPAEPPATLVPHVHHQSSTPPMSRRRPPVVR